MYWKKSEIVFPIGITGPAVEQTMQAKRICNARPVINEYLEWELDTNQGSGVWGGLSEDERRILRNKSKKVVN